VTSFWVLVRPPRLDEHGAVDSYPGSSGSPELFPAIGREASFAPRLGSGGLRGVCHRDGRRHLEDEDT